MIFSIIVRKRYLYGHLKYFFPQTFSTSLGHTGDNLERRFRRHLGGRGLTPKRRISSYDDLRCSTPGGAYRHMTISIFLSLSVCLCMYVCMYVFMYVGYICMGEHQIFFNFFNVFFVHPSGPLDLLM